MKKILLFLILFLFIPSLFSSQQMRITTVENSVIRNVTQKIMKEAYKRLGIDISIEPLPAKRALYESNFSTNYDGELHRIEGLEKKYPNLIPVLVPIFYLEGVVVTHELDFKVDSWKSLKPYVVGLKRGIIFASEETNNMNRVILNSSEKLFQMLSIKRLDVIIMPRIESLQYLKEEKNSNLKILEPPLHIYKMYHYLNKKNKHLIPKLTSVLQDMEKEGFIKKTKDDYMNKNF